MAKFDYYKVLGLNKNASIKEVKNAYRRLAVEFHPDKNPANSEKFIQITKAYKAILNPESEQEDEANKNNDIFSHFNESLEDFFNTEKTQHGNKIFGNDIKVQLKISLGELMRGTRKEVSFNVKKVCDSCKGTGSEMDKIECPSCKGSGKTVKSRGFVTVNIQCHNCGGEGNISLSKCIRCDGNGDVLEKKTKTIEIVPGFSKEIIKFDGEGSKTIKDVNPGNLFVYIDVENDPGFKRVKNDLVTTKTISFPDAVLGNDMEIVLPDGKTETVKIPPGVQTNSYIVKDECGIRTDKGEVGSLVVNLNIDVPKNPSPELIELVQNMKKYL